MSSRTRLWVDGVLLATLLVTLVSGLTLLLAFHMGGRWFRPEALGWSRLAWQNLHRLGAVGVLVGVAAHVVANLRSIRARLRRTWRGAAVGPNRRELLFYVVFITVVATGFAIWLCLPGSLPLVGPVRLSPVPHDRHQWIDVHNPVGLGSLYLTTGHLRRHWSALRALARRALSVASPRLPERPTPWRAAPK